MNLLTKRFFIFSEKNLLKHKIEHLTSFYPYFLTSSIYKQQIKQTKSVILNNFPPSQYFSQQAAQLSIPYFKSYNLSKELLNALEEQKIQTPTPIQDLSLKQVLSNRNHNYYLAAQTGTGQTLAYLIPIISYLQKQQQISQQSLTVPLRPRALILVPSKELANQVEEVCKNLSHHVKIKSYSICNSKVFMAQRKVLKDGVDILIGTIDRVQRHRLKQYLYLSSLQFLVIDEADTFLDSGYKQAIDFYVNLMKRKQQNNKEFHKNLEFAPQLMFVSATFTGQLNQLFTEHFGGPQQQEIKKLIEDKTHMHLENLSHEFIHCTTYDKKEPGIQLIRECLVQAKQLKGALMIFCNSISSAHSLEYFLVENGIEAVSLHGDVPQQIRIQNFQRFKRTEVSVLISTDLGSRGLDFPFLTHVINFDFPLTTSDYLHRAGRSGRAGKQGFVFSLYHNKDMPVINQLNDAYTNQSPIQIQGSAYSHINREVLKSLQQKSQESGGDYQVLRNELRLTNVEQNSVIPVEYTKMRNNWINAQKKQDEKLLSEKNIKRTYLQKNIKVYSDIKKKFKQHQRVSRQSYIRGLDMQIRQLRRKSFNQSTQRKSN